MQTIASSFPFAPFGPAFSRFLSYVDVSGSCWVWTGCKTKGGYSQIRINYKRNMVHRIAFLWANGYLTEGLTIDHLCRNRACVNPNHLEEVTNHENILRGEGVAAKQARQTHCKRGHRLNEENIYSPPSHPTKRECKICKKDAAAHRQLVAHEIAILGKTHGRRLCA